MSQKEIRPSILDRLLGDQELSDSATFFSMNELRESVQRDIQNLLNSRIRFLTPDPSLEAVQTSVLNYGLPDLASHSVSSVLGKREFAQWIETAIRRFEPRFMSVTVTPLDNEDSSGFAFRVDAKLYADPAPEDVSFDSEVDPMTLSVELSEAHR